MKIYRNIALALVCIILGIGLALQFRSINHNEKLASFDNQRLDVLRDELIRQRETNDALILRNEELKSENLKYEQAKGDTTAETKNLQEELKRVRTIAGLVDVKGKGLIVTIDKGESPYVDDSDILLVLNELRASDAQAISVNDERIISTSEVRVAGRYIMINRKQMLPPFVIKSIADPDKLEHALRMMDGVIEKLETYKLAVKVEKSEELLIPKVRDDGSVIKIDLLSPVEQK